MPRIKVQCKKTTGNCPNITQKIQINNVTFTEPKITEILPLFSETIRMKFNHKAQKTEFLSGSQKGF